MPGKSRELLRLTVIPSPIGTIGRRWYPKYVTLVELRIQPTLYSLHYVGIVHRKSAYQKDLAGFILLEEIKE